MDLLPPAPTLAEPHFNLGRPQARLLVAFAAIVAAVGFAVDRARYTFVMPGAFPRATENLLAYRTLPETPEVLLVRSSRFDFGFDAHLLQETLSENAGREVPVYKVSQRGMHSWLLYNILRDYTAVRPPTELLVIGIDLQLFEVEQTARALEQTGRLQDVGYALDARRNYVQRS